MTLYELLDLYETTNELIVAIFGVFLTISSAAFAGAYVAGNRLTPLLMSGIIFVYSIAAFGIMRFRFAAGRRSEALYADIQTKAQEAGNDYAIVGAADLSGQTEIAMAINFAIWAAVVFFVVYARQRIAMSE